METIAAPLEIRLFGTFDARVHGEPMPHLRSRAGQWLLALLVLRHGDPVERAWLAGTLWPDSDEEKALYNLRRNLTDLRQALGPEAYRLESPTARTLRLDLSDACVDVASFDEALAHSSKDEGGSLHPSCLILHPSQVAVEVYRGPLLEGCLEEWVLPERDVREQAYVRALETLGTQAMDRGEPLEAARHLRRGVSLDPLRESMQRALMQALAAGGDAAAAIQVYRDLRLLLHREMRIAPAPETTAVLERIRGQSRLNATTHATAAAPAAPPPRRIPQPVSTLIGRQSEVQEIRTRLGAARLVTLTGAGGVGKTRLGIQVAEEVAEEYPDGVWFVELAALSDSSLVPRALASALSIREEPDRTLAETLLEALRPKTLLLILDNCEHLIEACARLIENILTGCPYVCVLATSREALGVGGEAAWRVPSLSVPTDRPFSTGEKNAVSILLEYDSVRLFVHRAALVRPDFRLTTENVRAVAEICGSLDGMPLAIELAAARLKAMSAEQIASRLGDRFRLLTGGSRTALPRQQTLRATLDWGYDLLAEEEKRALRWLSVLAGGWTQEAAEAVCGDCGMRNVDCGLTEQAATGSAGRGSPNPKSEIRNPQWEVLDLLERLVDKSLVVYEEQAVGARYHLLETVRQYGRDRLLESGENETAHERHCDFFLQMAEDTEPQLVGNEQTALLAQLEVEHVAGQEQITGLVDSREIYLIFELNPDGGEYDIASGSYQYWRKNRQPNDGAASVGTDPNRNHSYKWGCCGGSSSNPASETYRGVAPASTPEVAAMERFVNSRVIGGRQQIAVAITFHTYGELILWPYGYTFDALPPDMWPDDHAVFVALGQAMAASNSYQAMQASGLYTTDGDFVDWAYGRHRIFAFTFEMYPSSFGGEGFYPPASVIAAQTARNRDAVLYLLGNAGCPYATIGKAAERCTDGRANPPHWMYVPLVASR